MEIEFLKMQACGDDSIIVRAAHLPPGAGPLLPVIAQRILDRSFGVGGNALLVMGPSETGDLAVQGFDPQGEEPALSCHGVRCLARYASDSGAAHGSDFMLNSPDGRIRVQIIDSSNVRVDMGMPMSVETQEEIRESPNESFTRSSPRRRAHPYLYADLPGPLVRDVFRSRAIVPAEQDGAADRGAAGLPGRDGNRLREGVQP